VQDYVERTDARMQQQLAADPPTTEDERREMLADAEVGAEIVRNPDDPRGDELIYRASKEILSTAGRSINEPDLQYAAFAEWVRRGLLELDSRRLVRLRDQHGRAALDHLFHPDAPAPATFGEIADQYLHYAVEEAQANGVNEKWVDKQRAQVALIREIVGDATPVSQVDFDSCRQVRSIVAGVPTNRHKIYPSLSLADALARAEAEGRGTLSPTTQQGYLSALRDILDLAAKKRFISINPAEGITPLRRDTMSDAAKRKPFTPEQLKQFFEGKYYHACAQHPLPYEHAKPTWRFWLPLLCLFMGLRPNEACQMNADDVKHTSKGTWYTDIVASDDEDEATVTGMKTLKTSSSRRKVPIHPELIKIGFLNFAENQKKAPGSRLFPDLKPDQYGNHASYALKRFRESFLPAAMILKPRQTFYSFRHNFRDALRHIGAPPDALQALGGWSQGKLTSDSYDDKTDPDYQIKFMKQVAFPGLDLAHLYCN
jgi:integrase